MPDEAFLRNPRNMSRRPPSIRRTRARDAQAPPLPDFPNIPDIPMHDQGEFQRFVVDALQAIWARVLIYLGFDPFLSMVHAQRYQKQQGERLAVLRQSCSFGTHHPLRSTFHIARCNNFVVDRYAQPTIDRHQTIVVDRSQSILELKRHFTRADHLEVDEGKNNRSMRISADNRYQEMPRQMKINIDRCTQVPSIDVETPDATSWILQT
ncbi:hypothetical protein F2Q70_00021739 [Brassica cretica]|uniref:Uncharacterized protein n=1 Tax=Brassica cretica TaxID=69181 RepID=A0A8S9HQ00_BRACR|nr:hypothetical protein F2Q70_00021739 [Brassica cretica]KAF2560023.1 hypothetical protein F2Q68_00015430 [Brassica cretica]